jgi:hypothetical protein
LFRIHAARNKLQVVLDEAPETGKYIERTLPGPTHAFRSENTFLDGLLMFVTNEEFGAFYLVFLPLLTIMTIRRDRPTSDLRIWIWCMTALLLFFPAHFPKYTLQRDPRYYVCLTVPAALCFVRWMGDILGQRLSRWVYWGVLASNLAALIVTADARRMATPRFLHEFQKLHRDEVLWVTPREGAFLAVYSGMTSRGSVAIHFFEQGSKSNAGRQYFLYDPEVRTAESMDEITEGYVAIDENRRGAVPSHWKLVTRVPDTPSPLVGLAINALQRAGVPKRFTNKLRPGGGTKTAIYHVTRE